MIKKTKCYGILLFYLLLGGIFITQISAISSGNSRIFHHNYISGDPINSLNGYLTCSPDMYPDTQIETYHYIDILQYMTNSGDGASYVVMELGTPYLLHTELQDLNFAYFASFSAQGDIIRSETSKEDVFRTDYYDSPATVERWNNHATHVCGIIHQIAPNANLIYLQIASQENQNYPFGESYITYIDDSAQAAFNWTVDNKDTYNIRTVSCSFSWNDFNFDYETNDPFLIEEGYEDYFQTDLDNYLSYRYTNGLERIINNGITPVFCTGNQIPIHTASYILDLSEKVKGPAKLNPEIPGLISVGAVAHYTPDATIGDIVYEVGNRWFYSTFTRDSSDEIDVMSSGVGVASILSYNEYGTAEGTSQATPIVAGVVLMLSLLGFDPIEIDNLIREYAKPLDIELDFDTEQYRGQGALDLTGYLCGDFDGDYVENWAEHYYGTDLNNPNTDGDTALDLYGNPVELTDYLEIYWFSSDPTDPNCKPADWDSDEDGLNDWDEYLGRYNEDYNYESTNWFSADSDGDGFTDYEECMGWGRFNEESDPNDFTSNPLGFPFVP